MSLKYSVLMSVYKKEKADYFKESILSMLNQTIIPDEIIIVKDGSLTDELEKVVDEFKNNENIKFIQLKKNYGLGKALRIGVLNCKNEYIARMDTDDISESDRCEKQLKYFNENPKLSLIGTSISEFVDSLENVISYRRVPVNHNEIKKYIKTRNPFNHPSVMFKKNDVIRAGSYKHCYLNEDYYLWVRMLLHNCEFANIDEPLLNMRINEQTFKRRGGWTYFIAQKKLFDYMLRHNLINITEYLYNNTVRFVIRLLLPNKIRKWLYLRFLRI